MDEHLKTLVEHRKIISCAMLDRSAWSDALMRIGQFLGAECSIFWMVENLGSSPELSPIASWGPPVGKMAHEFAQLSGRQDPWVEGAIRRGVFMRNFVRHGHELASERDWSKSPWVDFARSQCHWHLLTLNRVDDFGNPNLIISFFRPYEGSDFSDKSKQHLTDLFHDLSNAAFIVREFERMQIKLHRIESMLEYQPDAVWLLDDRRKIVWMNKAADQCLTTGDLFVQEACKLSIVQSDGDDEFNRSVASVLDGMARAFIIYDSDFRPHRIRMIPIDRAERSCAMIIKTSRSGKIGLTIDSLRKRYALTNAEAQLCLMLVEGLSLKEIAIARSTSITTARTQLSIALSKVGAKNQAGLISKVLRHIM